MGTARRILKNTAAVYSSNAADVVAGLLSVAIIARYLNLDDFGRYAFVVAFVAVFKVVSTMGINTILVREIARAPEAAARFYASALLIQVALSAFTFAIVAISFALIGSSAVVIHAAYLCALAVIGEFFGKTCSAVFQAFERMHYVFFKTVVSQGGYLAGVAAAAYFDLGLLGVFYAILLGGLLDAFFGLVAVRLSFIRIHWADALREAWFLAKEALPLGFKRIFRKLGFRIDTLILTALRSKVEVGLFHGVYKIVQTLMFVAEGSMTAVFPLFARYYGTREDSFNLIYEKSFKYLTMLGIPFAVFVSLFAELAIRLVLGPKFAAAAGALKILAWVLALMFLSNFANRILIIGGRQDVSTWITAGCLILNIVLDVALIPPLGIEGAALATLAAEAAITALSFYYVRKLITARPVLHEARKPLCAGTAALVVALLLSPVGTFVALPVAAATYIGALLLLKTFTEEERLTLLSALRRA